MNVENEDEVEDPTSDSETDSSESDTVSDSDDREMFPLEDLEKIISENNAPNFHHHSVQVPNYTNPFIAHPELKEAFVETLQHVTTTNFISHGLGFHPEEWDNDRYPTGETICIGAWAS
ncbi:hypothetical protein QCA50_007975 [Cerrena zonata]|uniref:Uncharacterized protein n=1 Tax=Cerrena zonata TaxID=2478898 RepID=A0AAW0GEP5_9APHY